MKVIRHPQGSERPGGSAITLGNFDGVHLGHQAVLARLVSEARRRSVPAIAVTFHPHPASIVAPERTPLALTALGQRLGRLAAAAVDVVVLQRFSRSFAAIDARSFARDFLLGKLGAQIVVIGHSTRFGRGREGNAERLKELGDELGFAVEVVPPIEVDGKAVSSSAIRAAVHAGDLAPAARMLGSPHSVCGRVVKGHGRGRGIGIPTANVRVAGLQLPPDGVYAVRARFAREWIPAVANIGFNPTFGNRERSLEVHLLDFDGDLYRKRLEVAFIEQLRGEIRFADVAALVRQIEQDIASARVLLRR